MFFEFDLRVASKNVIPEAKLRESSVQPKMRESQRFLCTEDRAKKGTHFKASAMLPYTQV